MVIPSAHQKPHDPAKFYGAALPRPRFHPDGNPFADRVEPMPSVMDPVMQWANDAHWSMGGLSFKRLRLQGRIEGNVEKLRVQREKAFKRSHKQKHQKMKPSEGSDSDVSEEDQDSGSDSEVSKTPSPPPAPVAIKRRRVVGLLDKEESADARETNKRGPVRKLRDEFERVASESGMAVDETYASDVSKGLPEKTKRTRKLVKGGGKVGSAVASAASALRKSPRLSRNRPN